MSKYTDKGQSDAVWDYICQREAIGQAQGYFRCENSLKDAPKCKNQCFECNQIYKPQQVEK